MLWEEALGVPGPGVRLPMTCRLRGGGGVRSEMRRQRDCEMALKNSWRRKENHSGRHMHEYSGGDRSQAPDWGMWQRCNSSSGTRASMGGYPRGRPWRGDCWRLQGMGTSKGRSKRSYLDSGWRRRQVSFGPWWRIGLDFIKVPGEVANKNDQRANTVVTVRNPV